MRLKLSESIYIETDHIESVDFDSRSISMVSGKKFILNMMQLQSAIEIMKNKDAISTSLAY